MNIRFSAALLLAAAIGMPQVSPARTPQMQSTLLWQGGTGGYETYRIPGIVVTARGTVLAYGVGRRYLKDGDWSDSDILLRRSLDGGQSWQMSQHIAGDSHGVTDNPVAIADHEHGLVHLLYQHDYARVFYMRSNDDGANFSKPVDITAALEGLRSQFNWTVVALGPGHAIQLRSGRLLVPVWMAAGTTTVNGRRKHAPSAITTLYSDDDGKTWQHGELIAADSPAMRDPNEMQLVQLSNGSVMANIRTGDKTRLRAVAVSPDGISRWTKPSFDPHLYDPICEAGIVRYDRHNILFTNPDSQSLPGSAQSSHGLRRNLTLKMSEDEGKTWPVSRLLHEGSAGYSDVAVAPDKTIYVVYEGVLGPGGKGNSISVLRFNMAWVKSK
ncbi:sialidase family protein [Edaphobacter sp.]|uniref:sialidase family protein n=1 Tax=Edaphobacter sp. TaxID=1934404 RepID=UPI002DB6A9F9|nr:sialidase family protein [Edaphobacter sp.]HEU5340021.1 sialidase family protein [Edaphobacter sp.]